MASDQFAGAAVHQVGLIAVLVAQNIKENALVRSLK